MADRGSWTPLKLLRWTTGYFSDHGIEHARSEAEILLAHVLGIRRIDLYINYDQPLSVDELAGFKGVIKRRVDHEPVAYITGTREFWSLELAVNPSVLIPRPETECLVEAVLPFLGDGSAVFRRVLELGTGSGAIVLALAKEHPEHRYLAMDRSFAALQTAKANAARHGLGQYINWYCGDWLLPLSPIRSRFDVIVSNPPYIPRDDIGGLQPDIRIFEPKMALDGSKDGLSCHRSIIASAYQNLTPNGILALEMGYDQAEAVTSIASKVGQYAPVEIVKDYSGHDRVAVLSRSS
jgi:release factor glutamine methyltransferase